MVDRIAEVGPEVNQLRVAGQAHAGCDGRQPLADPQPRRGDEREVRGEQTPKGGALTLNALGGIGMLAVGVLGFPYIGALQAGQAIEAIEQNEEITAAAPALVDDAGALAVTTQENIYSIINYDAISEEQLTAALAEAPDSAALTEQVQQVRDRSKQGALANMCVFPAVMLVGYIALAIYFRSRGGYQAKVLTGHAAEDEKFTGGTEGPGAG